MCQEGATNMAMSTDSPHVVAKFVVADGAPPLYFAKTRKLSNTNMFGVFGEGTNICVVCLRKFSQNEIRFELGKHTLDHNAKCTTTTMVQSMPQGSAAHTHRIAFMLLWTIAKPMEFFTSAFA